MYILYFAKQRSFELKKKNSTNKIILISVNMHKETIVMKRHIME